MGEAKSQKTRRWLVWLLAVAALFLLTFWVVNASKVGPLQGCPQGCMVSSEIQGNTLRVISMNILHGFPFFRDIRERMGMVADEIQRQDADIVLLQEVPWTLMTGSVAEFLADRTGMNYAYLPANGNRWAILFSEGEAILSKYALKDVTYIELHPKAGPFQHRVALQASVATPWGDLRLVSTHLTNGKAEINQKQAASLESFVAGDGKRSAIVAGDFNAREDSPQIQELSGHWVDVYRKFHPEEVGNTCCIDDLHGAPGEPLEERIDYVFLAPGELNIRILGIQRILEQPVRTTDGWQWASDHLGLLATLELGP
jgi:endonuclease/exonuclease/phosphatase family metal-dependent hydrolase